jgi:Protein of unknown function (DUF559)
VPPAPHRPPELRGKVFRGSWAVQSAALTPKQLRSGAWRRLFPDVYACTDVAVTHRLRAEAVVRLLVPEAVASGRSAAVVWGVDLAGSDDDVEVTVPPASRAGAIRGVRTRRRALEAERIVTRGRVRVTDPVQTAFDLAALRPHESAVIALDRLAGAGVVDLADARTAAARLRGRNCRHVRTTLDLADGLAASPQETRVRLLLHASPLPRPVAQHTVRDRHGGFVARVDFAWPQHKVALEYEGIWHGEPQQVARDRQRLNRLTAEGWIVLFVTAADLRRPQAVVDRVAAALARTAL